MMVYFCTIKKLKYFLLVCFIFINLKMKTRSQTREEKYQVYESKIDFDDASEAWCANKKSI
jgi:hypothetical protein